MNNYLRLIFASTFYFWSGYAASQPLLSLPDAGSMSWGQWNFDWNISGNDEGLVLRNVRFKNMSVLYKASMPVVRVKYRGNGSSVNAGAGPFMDRIHDGWWVFGNIQVLQGASSKVVSRIFGDNTLEIAVYAEIGGYQLYQAYYFDKSGRLEPVLYSGGWSHKDTHKHHPYWRLDFDVGSPVNEVWQTSGASSARISSETNLVVPAPSSSRVYTISQPNSSNHVIVRYFGNESIDRSGRVWFSFSTKDYGLRRYHGNEDVGWPWSETSHLGFNNLEATSGQDIVLWVVGHLTHTYNRGEDEQGLVWHWTGPTIDVVW